MSADGILFYRFLLFVSTILLFTTNEAIGDEASRQREVEIQDKIFEKGVYDMRLRPTGANSTGPAVVKINMYMRSITRIDDVLMEYDVQVTVRQQWMDERLKFDDMEGKIDYLKLTDTRRLWMPDLFFTNERNGHFHDLLEPNVYARIFPSGSVLLSIRVSLTLACPMNLKLYPFDKQTCSMKISSYGLTTDDLVLLWKDVDPIQVTNNLHLPRFTLEKFATDYCNSKTNTGEYSCLKVDLLFKREFSYYLTQIYIPCCMLVIVSWMSFWLEEKAVVARIFLGFTTLLVLATQVSGVNESLPPVSYTKAIDNWTGICITFVFCALLEVMAVNYVFELDMQGENAKKQQRTVGREQAAAPQEKSSVEDKQQHLDDGASAYVMKPLMGQETDPATTYKARPPQRGSFYHSWISRCPRRSKRIDVISRVIFPLAFFIFNVGYWCTYL